MRIKHKKKTIGMMLTGLAFIIGAIFTGFAEVPNALPQVFSLIAMVAEALGLTFLFPDLKE